ncbi:MAG: hypothetical protein KAU20_05320 [Nanoarchaeota archaeon]|nr:hypothetical protein [Nanoarchaeota archaeon]
MAAGTVTILGPYALSDTATMATDLSAEAGAIIKSITSWQDIDNKQVWFLVCTEA